jgi:transposase, IS5 family
MPESDSILPKTWEKNICTMRHRKINIDQHELFRERLSDQLDMNHELVKLRKLINWQEIEAEFECKPARTAGRKALPVRLMIGLLLLQYLHRLSDEAAVRMWKENPYWQYFCGHDYLQSDPPAESSSLSRWRSRMGEEKLDKILSATVGACIKSGAVKLRELRAITADTTVMPKNIEFPTDAKLIAKGIGKIAALAKKNGVRLNQTYKFVAKRLVVKINRYFHAKQLKRAASSVRRLKTIGGRILRDCQRKVSCEPVEVCESFAEIFRQMDHLLLRKKGDKGKIYSLHEESSVSCISKGKAHTRYEFGCKVALCLANTGTGVVSSARSFHDNPYDGHTLKESLEQSEKITGVKVQEVFVDKGYKGHGVTDIAVFISGQRRGITGAIKRKLKRRQAIEAHIGHMKNDGKLGICRLKGINGNCIHVMLCAAAYNLRLILNYLRDLLRRILEHFFIIKIRIQTLIQLPAF